MELDPAFYYFLEMMLQIGNVDRTKGRGMLWGKPEILACLRQLVAAQIEHHRDEATTLRHRIDAWAENGKLGGDEGWQTLSALRRLKTAMSVEELPDQVDKFLLHVVSF